MNADQMRALRAPFDESRIGKLPRIWCKRCRDSPSKACADHKPAKCRECGQKHSTAAMHLSYVGHADTTDRLLEVDPEWSWEPMAFDEHGLPLLDAAGGLWIRLTVCGKTIPAYGDADGKRNAVKELIGDAIRNGAMRFGVALDLWRKTDSEADRHSVALSEPPVGAGVPPDPLADAKALVWHLAQTKDWDRQALSDDYVSWSQGGALSEATAEDLTAYAKTLEPTTIVRRAS